VHDPEHFPLVGCGKEIVSMAAITGCPSSEGLEKAMTGWTRTGGLGTNVCVGYSEGLEKAMTDWKFKHPPELVFLHV